MIGGEFGIITSIEVEMIHTNNPKCIKAFIKMNGMGISDFVKKILSTSYDGNVSIMYSIECRHNDLLCVIFTYFSNDINYPTTVFEDILKFTNIVIINMQTTTEDFSWVYVDKLKNSYREYDNMCRICDDTYKYIDELIGLMKSTESIWIGISNPRYIIQDYPNNYLYIAFVEPFTAAAAVKPLLDKYCPDNIKYLNIPMYGLELKNYITSLSKMSLDELVDMKRILDPAQIFVTRYNLGSNCL
jgi:hypothetical protein